MASTTLPGFSVHQKIVVITGGGAGIGLAYARIAHKKGAKVIIADLKLHNDARDLENGEHVAFAECDVTKWEDLESLVKFSQDRFGDVPDVYVASAGVFEKPKFNFWEDVDEDRYAIFDVNVNHPIKLTRLAIRALLGARKQGVVCIVASIAGYTAFYPTPLYSASKHALIGFTKSMAPAQDMQGVKIVALCPGIVDTPLWNDDPSIKELYSVTEAVSMSASTVADALDSLVEDGKYSGGTILEISKLGTRVIPEWGIQPPGLANGEADDGTDIPQEAITKSLAPLLKKTEEERGNLR